MVDECGHASDLYWTSAIAEAFNAALTNVVKKGAETRKAFEQVRRTARTELERVKK